MQPLFDPEKVYKYKPKFSPDCVHRIPGRVSTTQQTQLNCQGPRNFDLNPNVTLLRCFQNSGDPRNFFRNRDDFRDHMSHPGFLETQKLEFSRIFQFPGDVRRLMAWRKPESGPKIPDSGFWKAIRTGLTTCSRIVSGCQWVASSQLASSWDFH